MNPDQRSIRELLERKVFEYNRTEFIPEDPISVPHRFQIKEDIEIAGFITAIISWGQRKTIISNALKFMEMMDDTPYQYLLYCSERELQRFKTFKNRTFSQQKGNSKMSFAAVFWPW